MARHFNRRQKQSACSSQNSFAYSVHLFQSNQRFYAIEFVDRHVSEKALNLLFSKLSSQNMSGFGHTTIPIPSFHCLR